MHRNSSKLKILFTRLQLQFVICWWKCKKCVSRLQMQNREIVMFFFLRVSQMSKSRTNAFKYKFFVPFQYLISISFTIPTLKRSLIWTYLCKGAQLLKVVGSHLLSGTTCLSTMEPRTRANNGNNSNVNTDIKILLWVTTGLFTFLTVPIFPHINLILKYRYKIWGNPPLIVKWLLYESHNIQKVSLQSLQAPA